MKKDFSIRAVSMIPVDGAVNVPTVILLPKQAPPSIGQKATKQARETGALLNQDFKIDLGNIDPRSTKRTPFPTAAGDQRSAAELTAEFIHLLLNKVRDWAEQSNLDLVPGVLVAEPLKPPEDEAWLKNYRANLKRILLGKRFQEEQIDFLPEPFAVFQYYRYGEKHHLLQQPRKQRVLVLDFGGGTFDACVIETTKEGNVSYSGANQRPLGARSEPIGGYLIDRYIAERLFEKTMSKAESAMLRKGLDAYRRWRSPTSIDLDTLSDKYECFVRNFHSAIYEAEEVKLRLSNEIMDWRLDAQLAENVCVEWPGNAFGGAPSRVSISFSALEFRDLFVRRIWEARLRCVVREVLDSARKEMGGAPIDLVLLSGGSANIGWLHRLLLRDFSDVLSKEQLVKLDDYQEVVAKGLAIECARRFYAEDGDFGSTTYNPLFLAMQPDNSEATLTSFKNDQFPETKDQPGMLIPVGTNMRDYVGKQLRWKFRLGHPPRHRLKYYFFRSVALLEKLATGEKFDAASTFAELLNLEEQAVRSPSPCRFDKSGLHLELTVRDDGTAEPRFVYFSGRTEADSMSVAARQFYLDMTAVRQRVRSKAYIGLDFGTSNTAVSYVDQRKIEQIGTQHATWMELNQLVTTLPYPLAVALAEYLAETEMKSAPLRALEFFEAALAVAAYTSYAEYCATKPEVDSRLLKGFTQRSVGPLWALLRASLEAAGKCVMRCAPYRELFRTEHELDDFVDWLADVKHGKRAPDRRDHSRSVTLLANVSHQVFGERLRFGYFEGVKKKRFGPGHHGRFRVAQGEGHFLHSLVYSGEQDFADFQGFVVSPEDGFGVALEPLVFWNSCPEHPSERPHCFLFDIPSRTKGSYEFKAAGFACTCTVGPQDEALAGLAAELDRRRTQDAAVEMLRGAQFSEPDSLGKAVSAGSGRA